MQHSENVGCGYSPVMLVMLLSALWNTPSALANFIIYLPLNQPLQFYIYQKQMKMWAYTKTYILSSQHLFVVILPD